MGFNKGDTLYIYGYKYFDKNSIAFECKVNNDWDFTYFGYQMGGLFTTRLSRYRILSPEVSNDGNKLNFKVCDYGVPNPGCSGTIFEVIK